MTAATIALLIAAPFVGSFVALAADRLPNGAPVLAGRSRCDACGATLRPRDLVPLLSFAWLRGRCRDCAMPIPTALPAIEAAAFAIALASLLARPDAPWIAPLGWALLLMSLLDLRHFWLPRAGSIALFVAGLAFAFHQQGIVGSARAAASAALAWAALALVAAVYRAARRRDGLGGGDSPFFAALTVWTGAAAAPALLLLACLSALLHALTTRRARADARIPLGAHLALAAWLLLLAGAR